MQILLVTPPLTQLNTSYPATAQLTGYLHRQGVDCAQQDLSIELIVHALERKQMETMMQAAEEAVEGGVRLSKTARIVLSNSRFYCRTSEAVCRFLQGKDLTLQHRFAERDFWPFQKGVASDDDLDWDYGSAGTYNRALYFCTLFLEHLSQLIRETISPHFELIRYAEQLCMSLAEADTLYETLDQPDSLVDQWMTNLLERRISKLPQLTHIGFSVPFPGNLYGALRCAAYIRQQHPHLHITMGGGYVNTELRQLTDARLFRYIDTLTFDDGELPLLRLLTGGEYLRTKWLGKDGQVATTDLSDTAHVPFRDLGAPCLDGLSIHLYMDTADSGNPMQRLWANGRWNKMMMAHGCYWAKCTFCDTSLDYIGRYDYAPAQEIADRMDSLFAQSGQSGFHFVDEAAPPIIVRKLSEELIQRERCYTWWTNIRFEKNYSSELCYLMSQAGCIAVSGGIEVASERVLKLINKGVSIASVRDTLTHFRDNHIMVHAYLMYGFPTQTEKELLESLDIVRIFFQEGLIQSAFWHRYAMTCHSPSGLHPKDFGAHRTDAQDAPFANNEVPFECPGSPNWENYSRGLKVATENYMRGTGFDIPVKNWFKKN